ncbi:MAG: putative extracellular nuclease [Candidatus Krumholzibacteriia bacterium]
MNIVPIHKIQGPGLYSPLKGEKVSTRGVVTGTTNKGFFIQDPDGDLNEDVSHGLFVFGRRDKPRAGSLVEVSGKVFDFQMNEADRPVTQLVVENIQVVDQHGPKITPVWFTSDLLMMSSPELALFLNNLEGMLVGIPAGATFAAPSNQFGDYVVVPKESDLVRTQQGGVLIDKTSPLRWLPGFRTTNFAQAPRVNVGAELLEPLIGPLNYRAESFQIAAVGKIQVQQAEVEARTTGLVCSDAQVTVMTLNGFNLDPHIENADLVKDPRRDIDDDVGDKRFEALGRAIAINAKGPAIVALQEIQDSDGAEITAVVEAQRTYAHLIEAVTRANGPRYQWLEIPPEEGADGGQPGGNIRNAFLFDPLRVQFVPETLQLLGADSPAFVDSRKPLAARFRLAKGKGELEVVNVHLASKRNQNGLFAPENPGFDPRAEVRVSQANVIGEHLSQLRAADIDYYVTGDFNDFEFSETLLTLTGDSSTNLVDSVDAPLRYDYNHRGISQALMHGVVANRQLKGRRAEYEILHANALIGVQPGSVGDKASDHAYTLALLEFSGD